MKIIFISSAMFVYGLYADALFVLFNGLALSKIKSNAPLTSRHIVYLSKKCFAAQKNFKKLEKILRSMIAKRDKI